MRRRWPLRAWAGALLAVLVLAAMAEAQERRPRILLSDDDGIAAAGLLAVYAELVKIGDVTVAAPAENQSGVGHGITYQEPLMTVQEVLVSRSKGLDDKDNPHRWWNTTGDWKKATA